MKGDIDRSDLVGNILSTFDRFMASESADEGFLDVFMGRILGNGYSFAGYSTKSVRKVLEALATNCPTSDLNEMLEHAFNLNAWVIGWELAHDYALIAEKPGALDSVDYEKLGRVTALSWQRFGEGIKQARAKRSVRKSTRRAT